MTFEPTISDDVDPAAPAESSVAPGPDVAPASGPSKPRSYTRSAIEWVAIIAAALLVALVIKTYLVQAFYIPSSSMEQTLQIRDRVLVNKLSYDLHPIHHGDIVVFKRPPNEGGGPEIQDLIKRVIGLPNDTIEARDGHVFVNDKQLNEPYTRGLPTDNLPRQVVPAGKYFVMGDNRVNSKDSRVFGPISGGLIVGRAFVRVWPLSRLTFL